MKPEACLEVANTSRKQAEIYFQRGNDGRAFAHYLMALKLCPSWKTELSQQFISALCSWGEKLDQQERYKDLFSCYEQALEVFPDSEEVLNNLGSHLYRWGHVIEAHNYFRRALACNPGFLPARRNLQGSCNLLVERWHYRMLNDSIRNDSYRAAITRRVLQQGSRSSVLDIGTGTGLLSLFAAEAGAERVFACDYSSTMIQIASEVLRANGAEEKVMLINKLSHDLVVPTDIPERLSLVVTETVDAGLLGEGILQSLIHAWDHLLLPSTGNTARVVPEAATLWVVPIECLHISRKYQLLIHHTQEENKSKKAATNKKQEGFDFHKIQLRARRDEPYDTEDLNLVPGGYRFLAAHCQVAHIKFSDREDMANWLNGQNHTECWLECTESGRVDALAAWFDLHLDDITTLTSTPVVDTDREGVYRATCWDQAIFPLQELIFLKSKEQLKIGVSCSGGKLSVDICNQCKSNSVSAIDISKHAMSFSNICAVQMDSAQSEIYMPNRTVYEETSGSATCKSKETVSENSILENEVNTCVTSCNSKKESPVPECDYSVIHEPNLNCVISEVALRFLNDEHWLRSLQECAKYLRKELPHEQTISVLDLCPFPILGLLLLEKLGVNLTCVVNAAGDEAVIKRLAELNAISSSRICCIDEKQITKLLEEQQVQYNVIMVHVMEPSGELKEAAFNMMPLLRSSLAEGGILMPQKISIWGQLLESEWLDHVSHIQSNSYTCGFDIANFINKFQVSQHLDLSLTTLGSKFLSSPTEFMYLHIDRDTHQYTHTASLSATHSGKANAIAYWCSIQIHSTIPDVSTYHSTSHVNQAAILLNSVISVEEGLLIKLLVRFYQGLLHIEHLQNR